ncbi:MAG: metallophosphoesterase [Tepidisphaeraceae bacterium]
MTAVPADEFLETLASAQDENRLSPMRQGNVVHLPAEGEVVMTGDIHDHRNNFAKLIRWADLANNPQRHLILHELIHGDHIDPNGAEDSWTMLYEAAKLKADYPNQVHFLIANHDLAQIFGEGIAKAGLDVCEAFRKGLKRDFPDKYHFAEAAISDFMLSLPLAIRTPNGLFFSHSLPRESEIDAFDYTVFDRELKGADYKRRTGAVYQLIWGRGATEDGVKRFLEKVGAKLLITGHQPQDTGYLVNSDQHLIVASDHSQGVFVPLSLSETYNTIDDLLGNVRKFVSVSFD